jgi:hypothetical protein
MINQRFQITTSLGDLRIRNSRAKMNISAQRTSDAFQLSVQQHQYKINISDPAIVEIDWGRVNEDLGFKNPKSFRAHYENYSRGKASSAIAQHVSEGDQYIRDPAQATFSIAKSKGAYSAPTQIASKPGVTPQVSSTAPSEITVDYQRPKVSTSVNQKVTLDPEYQKPGFSLTHPPQVNVRLVPWNIPGARVDIKA